MLTAVDPRTCVEDDEGWPSWVWICLGVAAVAAPLLLAWQARLSRRGVEAIIDVRLLANRPYTLLLAACAVFQSYFGCFMFTLSMLLQIGLGESADHASLMFACQGVLFTATSLRGGRLAARYGSRVPLTGAALVIAGMATLVAELAAGRPGSIELVIGLGVVGAGNGLLLPPLLGAALVPVDAAQAGAASGLLNTAQQFANALGVAVIGSVFFAVAGAGVADASSAMRAVMVIYVVLLLALMPLVRLGWPQPSRRPTQPSELVERGGEHCAATGDHRQ